MSSQPTELVSIREIQKYFAYDSIKEFSADWKALSEKDKADLRIGISNGTFTY